MLELYQMDHCPYCVKVRGVLQELGLEYISHDALPGTEERDRLVRLGGKQQVPFLVDNVNPENHVMMYESDDIIRYLREKYQ